MIGRLIGSAGRLILVIIAVILPIAIGFIRFVDSLPPPTTDTTPTDAIVVLTGGGDRIATGLALLAAGRANKLFVSGVHAGVDVPELLKIAHAMPGTPEPGPELASRIEVGDTAGDTFGNAVETAGWMRANRFRTMRLVTADYHMRRALIEFKLTAPELAILPNPVRPPGRADRQWWRDHATFDLLLGEYGKYLIVRWRYLLSQLTGTAL